MENRATRRRREREEKKLLKQAKAETIMEQKQTQGAIELLRTPQGQEIVSATTQTAMHVLKRDFGFGDKRLKRFLDGMMNGDDGHDEKRS